MSDNIGFEKQPDAVVPESFADSAKEKMRSDAIKGMENEQVKKQVRAEAGYTEIPKTGESIPKELPKLVFQIGAKMINCEKFALSPEEATTMAKHLSIIIGPVSSKVYSIVIVLMVITSKVSDCVGSIKKKFSRNKGDEDIEQNLDFKTMD